MSGRRRLPGVKPPLAPLPDGDPLTMTRDQLSAWRSSLPERIGERVAFLVGNGPEMPETVRRGAVARVDPNGAAITLPAGGVLFVPFRLIWPEREAIEAEANGIKLAIERAKAADRERAMRP
jgi:hypothetical protein